MEVLNYRTDFAASVPSKAKIFLIAGGKDNANFAQEVVDQIALWKKAGFQEEDIACYYAIPFEKEFLNDYVQYESISRELSLCYPASPKLIWEHLEAAAQSTDRDFLYVYVTSHGGQPLSEVAKKPEIGFPQKLQLGRILEALPELDQFLISMDVLPDGKTGNFQSRLESLASGEGTKDHLFTPRYLKAALKEFPASLPKYINIQGCYSGGFLTSPNNALKEDTLKSLNTIEVMTAARHDRTIFGCDSGSERTVFGQYFNQGLDKYLSHPHSIPWQQFYQETVDAVFQVETRMKVKPSEPQFYMNFEG